MMAVEERKARETAGSLEILFFPLQLRSYLLTRAYPYPISNLPSLARPKKKILLPLAGTGNQARICLMTIKEQALTALRELPENADLISIIRELSFLAGVEEASCEIRDGKGMDAASAKKKLREWVGE